MAEIKVEPKRSGLGWLWAIIALALLGVVVWYFMTQRTVPAATPADSTRTSMAGVLTPNGRFATALEVATHV